MMKLKIFIFSVLLIIILSCFWIWFSFKKETPITFKIETFNALPDWRSADFLESFKTFQNSCRIFLKQSPKNSVGSLEIPMTVKDWLPVCEAAQKTPPHTLEEAKKFFMQWFTPITFYKKKPLSGLFTGYYLPLLQGSLTKTTKFHVPIYGIPNTLVKVDLEQFDNTLAHKKIIGFVKDHALIPFYTRKKINEGVLNNTAEVLAWVDSEIDRLFLEIQGSGVIHLEDHAPLYVGYAAENGRPYTPIGKVLITLGILKPENTTMQTIRAYLEKNPKAILPVLSQNESFVFFKRLKDSAAIGAQGAKLTPGYSLAVDRKWIPLGTPIFLSTTRPDANSNAALPFKRLMIAQDTGGAIRGPVRGDVFWGFGPEATEIAGKMKQPGKYWLLLPKPIISRLPKVFPN